MNNVLEDIKNDIEIRQNLIALKNEIRDGLQKKTLAYTLAGDFSVFTDLLEHPDPKVRKNAALILGEMECDDLAELLWNAYQKEETLFIRADYLKALSHLDCSDYVESMKQALERLMGKAVLPEEEKHVRQECTALKNILLTYDRPQKHKFIGNDRKLEVILMTNRNHREVTRRQLGEIPVKYLAGGLRFTTEKLEDLWKIRTYSEMLFPLNGCSMLSGSPDHMAQQLLDGGIMRFLQELHAGHPPFYFRLELKSPMRLEQKADILKKLSIALEKQSGRKLVNTTSGYEFEIRLVANREGGFVPLLKLYTIADHRFAYRKNALATSIAPVNAALIMQLAGEYLKEYAQVLDPFCGAGTMLIERNRYGKVRSMYGLDILEEAVQYAWENTQAARLEANYIQRDFFDFRHEYPFDEIVTNLPVVGKTRDIEQVSGMYERFFERAPLILKPEAIIVAYTSLPDILRRAAKKYKGYSLQQEYCLNDRDGSSVLIYRYQRG
ncbi:MAG: methyltransferase domain-containing protein [Eubacteriales bacterium]|nr:methyltransferase domain-containing protein [Eubacteriales bacterium]